MDRTRPGHHAIWGSFLDDAGAVLLYAKLLSIHVRNPWFREHTGSEALFAMNNFPEGSFSQRNVSSHMREMMMLLSPKTSNRLQ